MSTCVYSGLAVRRYGDAEKGSGTLGTFWHAHIQAQFLPATPITRCVCKNLPESLPSRLGCNTAALRYRQSPGAPFVTNPG
jgi:hypothetical protein